MSRHDRGDAGFIGGSEGLVFGVLVFVLGTLVVVGAWGVIDAKLATTAAAREAARAYVESPSDAAGRLAAADAAAAAMVGHGRDPAALRPLAIEGAFARCARITVTARFDVHLPGVPLLGAGRTFAVSAHHSEVVDPFRTGAATGAAACVP